MAENNVVVRILLSLQDAASSGLSQVVSTIKSFTSETIADAGKIRANFSNLFGGGLEGANEIEAKLEELRTKSTSASASMEQLKKTATDTGAQVGAAGAEAAKGMDAASNSTSKTASAFKFLDSEISVMAGKVRAVFSTLFSGGLDSATAFEAQLDAVATKGSYTAQEMTVVSEKVSQVARDFRITGTEAAQAMEVLAAAGLSASDALAALPAVLALAKNEGIGFEQSANLISNSLSVMGMAFQEAGRMADVLTQGANISKTSAVAMGAALVEAGAGAKAAGLGLEQTVAILAAFAKNGLEGEKAGTALRNIFDQLADPASKAREELANIDITTGNAGEALNQLAKVPLPLAQKAINAFGTEAGPALRAYLNEGEEAIQSYQDQLEGIEGTAYDTSKSLSDNLMGAMEGLSSIWDEAKRKFAEPLLKPLKEQADALYASIKSFVDSGVLSSMATGFADTFVGGLNAARAFVSAVDLTPIAVAFERVKVAAVSAADPLGSAFPSSASAGATAGKALAVVMENLVPLIGAGLAAAGAKAVQSIAAMAASTYQWVTAQIAAREAARDQTVLMEAQRQEAIRLAEAQVVGAQAALNKALAERAHAAAVLAAMEANLGYGVSEADVAAARAANVAAGNAAIAANTRLAAANEALSVANAAAAASTTLLSRAMTFLAGPGGLILAAVGAFALLFAATDKQKPSTDALAKSTDEYAQALRAQTEWQIKAANVDVTKQIQQQQSLIDKAETQVKWAKLALVEVDRLKLSEEQRAQAQDRLAVTMATLDTEQQKLQGLEERRAQGLTELQNRQNGVADALKETEARMAPYQTALDAANKAHADAVAKLNELEPGMKGFGAAALAVQDANDKVAQAQARYNAELQNLMRGLPEVTDQSKTLAIQQALVSQELATQAEKAKEAADGADQLAQATSKTAAAEIEALKAERDLALARGDSATAGRLSAEIAERERAAAQDSAQALQASAAAARIALEAKQKAAAAAGDSTAKTLQEIEALKAEVAQKEASARTATARAQTLESESTQETRLLTALQGSIRTAYELAKAKGNELEARQLLIIAAQTEARLAQLTAEKKRIELDAAIEVTKAIQNEIEERQATGEVIDSVTMNRLKAATVAQQVASIEAQAAGQIAEAEVRKAAAIQLGTLEQQKATKQTDENTRSTHENTDAREKQNEQTADAGSLTKILNEAIAYSRKVTSDLSDATGRLFEKMLWKQNQKEVTAFSTEVQKHLYELDKAPDKYAAINKKIADMGAASRAASDDILFATNGVGRMFGYINKATADSQKAFYEQQLQAEKLADSLESATEKGAHGFGMLQQATIAANSGLSLLDEQDLSRLRSAIDAANEKLRKMQEEAQSAKDEIARLNAEIAEESGQSEKAALLKQQLDYQTALADIEAKRAEAEAAGNRELIALYDEQARKLAQLNALKEKNIKADADAKKNNTSTSSTSSSSNTTTTSSSGGGGISSGNATTVNNYFNVDSKDLLSEQQIRKKVIPVLNRTLRLGS